jgi:GNAT superfamily N-acetyltransferase
MVSFSRLLLVFNKHFTSPLRTVVSISKPTKRDNTDRVDRGIGSTMEVSVISLAAQVPQLVATAEFPFTDLSRTSSGAHSDHREIVSLSREHRTAYRDLLLGLDAPARLSRFACPLSDDGILKHADYAVREAAWIAGLFVTSELCGVVELYECRDPQDLEAAFAVANIWRRQGVGTALLFAAIGWARRSHRSCLRMMFSRHNWPMRRLAGKAEPRLDLDMEEFIASVMIDGARCGAALD